MTDRRPNQKDLIDALGPLADRLPGKRYSSAELLPVYNDWAGQNDLDPLTPQKLGMALGRETTLDRGRRHQNLTDWVLTRAGLECRNWYV